MLEVFLGLVWGLWAANVPFGPTTFWSVPCTHTDCPALHMALDDVATDWYKVVGRRPRYLVDPPPQGWSNPIVRFTVGTWSRGGGGNRSGERFTIDVDTTGKAPVVTCDGDGERGAIYAAYYFAERVLGVDPWWWFMDIEPHYRGSWVATVDPYDSGEPEYKVRGWFPNDEDISGNRYRDPVGQSVYSPEFFNRMCEALLRLRGNAIIVGTVGFPDENTFSVATRRGLSIAEHHITPLGVNCYAWPRGIPFSYRVNKEVFRYAWEAMVDYQVERDMLWSVGMRGLWDQPFYVQDPYCKTDAERAAVISKSIHDQMTILTKASTTPPRLYTYMWSEAIHLWEKGLLKIPKDVVVVFTDSGAGYVNGKANVTEGSGLYYHVMMLDGHMNQIAEAIPPSRMFSEMGYFSKKKATNYTVINVSDIRPAPLTIEAAMRFLWNSTPYTDIDPQAAQRKFLTEWCERMFPAGDPARSAAVGIYTSYFNISYLASAHPVADQHLTNVLEAVLLTYTHQPINTKAARDALAFVSEPGPYVQALYNTAKGVSSTNPIYVRHTILNVAIHHFLLSSIRYTAEGLLAYAKGDTRYAVGNVTRAVDSLEDLLDAQRAAEGNGQWRGYYMHDYFTDVPGVYSHAVSIQQLVVHGVSGVPVGDPPQDYANLFEYECQRNSEVGCSNFPFLHPHSNSMAAIPRVTCGGACATTWTGGLIKAPGDAIVTVASALPSSSSIVRYTTDGSVPTPSSSVYSKPFHLQYSNITLLTLKAFTPQGIPLAVETVAEFRTH